MSGRGPILPTLLLVAGIACSVILAACHSEGGEDDIITIPETTEAEQIVQPVNQILFGGSTDPYEINLDGQNGEWIAIHDPEGNGQNKSYPQGKFSKPMGAVDAPVPGNFNMLSDNGVLTGDQVKSGVWWYRREFTPQIVSGEGTRYFLRFGGVDYYCDVYLNGTLIGSHEGQEVGFEIEATAAIKPGENNVLVVRVFQPALTNASPEMTISNIPKGQSWGGIQRSVDLYATAPVAITDLYSIPDMQTGTIRNRITISNPYDAERKVRINVTVTENGNATMCYSKSYDVNVPVGDTTMRLDATLASYKLWNLDVPTLYNVTITIDTTTDAGVVMRAASQARIGFREFVVKDGYFFLNGERIYLKCAHTVNSTPLFRSAANEDNFALADIYKMKAAGFNCVRFLVTPASKEQLDLCDELGIMVYQEHPGSWLMETGEYFKERFERSVIQRIESDRNHPSIVIWGLLNETHNTLGFQTAKNFLPTLRKYDDTRVVLLNSGRFDQVAMLGSVCNPGSTAWEAMWGNEGESKPGTSDFDYNYYPEYWYGGGDVHLYPREQSVADQREFFASLAADTKPIFVSEYGVASSWNAIASARYTENVGAPNTSYTTTLSHAEENILRSMIRKYGLDCIYPLAEDYYTDTERMQAKKRKISFDFIRANPQIVGYSMTSILDGGHVAEGFLGYLREFKKGQLEVIEQGWAELRWCLFATPGAVYADEPIKLEAVLASEDALSEGEYPVTLRVFGDEGIVWEKECTLTVKKDGKYLPLSFEVFKDEVRIDGLKEGTYTFAAELEKGGWARADRTEFTVLARENTAKLNTTVYTAGQVDAKVIALLEAQGATVKTMDPAAPVRDGEVILVGKHAGMTKAILAEVYRRTACGAHAVFLYPATLAGVNDLNYVKNGSTSATAGNLLLESTTKKGNLVRTWYWMYHSDIIAKPTDLLAGLQSRGILDMELYDSVISDRMYFTNLPVPDEVAAVEFGVGTDVYSANYTIGVCLGDYDFYGGSYTISGLSIVDNLGQPAADRVLVNLIAHAAKKAGEAVELNDDAKAKIEAFAS